ncbi:hypothetical protein BJX63DRAFT_112680 [Aspergillus granulosus]|uniref:Secreted protein n=1 Tax=Aspergillus granulosus TaxID=176169 RepID=A0ABR4HPI6_9EURO
MTFSVPLFVFCSLTFILCSFPLPLETRGSGYTIDWIGSDSFTPPTLFLHMLCHFEGDNLDNRCFSDIGWDDRLLVIIILMATDSHKETGRRRETNITTYI